MQGSSQEDLDNVLVFNQITLFEIHPYSSVDAELEISLLFVPLCENRLIIQISS